MKNLKSTILTTGLLVTGLLATSASASITSPGQATGLCKAQAEKAHPDYKRSKLVKIKQKRGIFKIKLRVVTETESITTFCDVTKDGDVSYSKA